MSKISIGSRVRHGDNFGRVVKTQSAPFPSGPTLYGVDWGNGNVEWCMLGQLEIVSDPKDQQGMMEPTLICGCRGTSCHGHDDRKPKNAHTTLPESSKERKDFPLYSGTIKYFPKALAEVAYICKIGNDKHNPGQPLHHARGKSMDHADCIARHLIDLNEDFGKGVGRDENGVPQVAYIAWRALALAQEWYEKNAGAPLAPGAKEAS
jgi:hypothetical protein